MDFSIKCGELTEAQGARRTAQGNSIYSCALRLVPCALCLLYIPYSESLANKQISSLNLLFKESSACILNPICGNDRMPRATYEAFYTLERNETWKEKVNN